MRRSIWSVLAAAPLVLACSSKSASKEPDPKPQPREAVVELASVTLADDCGDVGRPPPPPATPAIQPQAPAMPAASEPAARCAGPDCANHLRRACDQTSMQLALAAAVATTPTVVAVKKVELLDERGASLGELTARGATAWSDAAGAYQPWDQTLPAGGKLSVSYALSAPDWSKIPGGRWEAHAKKFQLRVTLTLGTADRTVEKKAISPAMIEPAVPT